MILIVKFRDAVSLSGKTYTYIDAIKHSLNIKLEDNLIVFGDSTNEIYVPLTNVISLEQKKKPAKEKT